MIRKHKIARLKRKRTERSPALWDSALFDLTEKWANIRSISWNYFWFLRAFVIQSLLDEGSLFCAVPSLSPNVIWVSFFARYNPRCILLRLHGVPDSWWMAGLTAGRGSSFWSCGACSISVYLDDSFCDQMEPGCFDITKDIRRTSACKCTLYWEETMWQQQDILYLPFREREREKKVSSKATIFCDRLYANILHKNCSNFNQENTLGSGEINKSLK